MLHFAFGVVFEIELVLDILAAFIEELAFELKLIQGIHDESIRLIEEVLLASLWAFLISIS